MRTYGRHSLEYLEEIKKKMITQGYINPSNDAAYVFDRCTPRQFNLLLENALRLSIYEAEEIMLSRSDPQFKLICKVNENMMLTQIKEGLEKNGLYSRLERLTFAPDHDVLMYVKEKHAKPLNEPLIFLERKC